MSSLNLIARRDDEVDRFQPIAACAFAVHPAERAELAAALQPAIGLDRVCAAIDGARPAPLCCPDYGSKRHYRHSVNRGLQRYRCRVCGRTFSALSGTPLARLRHRAKWLDFLKEMLDSRSMRAAAKLVGVHRNTSFRWRHRFLDGARRDQPERLAFMVSRRPTCLTTWAGAGHSTASGLDPPNGS